MILKRFTKDFNHFFKTGPDGEKENVTESIVSEGLVEVRRGGIKPSE